MTQRMRLVIFPTIFLLLFLCSACGIKESRTNRNNLAGIRVGMTKTDVLAIMGEPEKGGIFDKLPSSLWFYYTNPQWNDGYVTRDECTPFIFDDSDVLVGFGQEYYKKYVRFAEGNADDSLRPPPEWKP